MKIDMRDPAALAKKLWRYTALLDGAELPLCVMADEEAGVALIHLWDRPGRTMVCTPDGEPLLIEVRGKVELRPPSNP